MKLIERLIFIFLILFFFLFRLPAQDVLRGQVIIDLDPIYGFNVDEEFPFSEEVIFTRTLEKAALLFSAQIYGWSFHYDVGERARGIDEELFLEPKGAIHWGDPALKVTSAAYRDNRFEAWIDYRPHGSQIGRLNVWRAGQNKSAQALGYCSQLGDLEASNWLAVRRIALEDAARSALREMLRGSERNRPKEAAGFISLQSFPRFFISSGRWVCSARFLIEINEVIPFSVY